MVIKWPVISQGLLYVSVARGNGGISVMAIKAECLHLYALSHLFSAEEEGLSWHLEGEKDKRELR